MLPIFVALVCAVGPLRAQGISMTVGAGLGATMPEGTLADQSGSGWTAQARVGWTVEGLPVGFRAQLLLAALARESSDQGGSDPRITAGTLAVELPIISDGSEGGLRALAGGGVYRVRHVSGVGRSDAGGATLGLAYRRVLTGFRLGLEASAHHVFTERDGQRFFIASIAVDVPILGR